MLDATTDAITALTADGQSRSLDKDDTAAARRRHKMRSFPEKLNRVGR